MNIPFGEPVYYGLEETRVVDALRSTWISGGPYVDEFESTFSRVIKSKYVLTVSNGTAALHLAYLALGLKAGDEIIVPSYAFEAAANVAKLMGLKIIYADVHPITYCVTRFNIEKVMTKRTKAIVVVHTYGGMANVEDIKQLGLPVIEDAAESLFSTYNSKDAGTIGTIGTFSFHATKTLTTGEGGAVCTDDEELYELMKLYRSHGLKERGSYHHTLAGHNFRMSNLNAALGCAQLANADTILLKKLQILQWYYNYLGEISLCLQGVESGVIPIFWAFGVRIPPVLNYDRDYTIKMLSMVYHITTRPGFECKDRNSIVSKQLSQDVIVLPGQASLLESDVKYICESLGKVRRKWE